MEELLLLGLLNEVEEFTRMRSVLRNLRDNSNPFNIPDALFIRKYRLPKALCMSLIEELEPFDTQKTKLPFTLRFLCSMYFFANGSFQACVGANSDIGFSQPSVSRALAAVSELIVRRKKTEISFPKTNDEQIQAKIGFHNAFGIKGTIGAIDCTHINILSPSQHDTTRPLTLYMNRKGNYSINVEAVCDHRLIFTSVNAKFPGSCHDSGIWTTSPTRIHLMRNRADDTWLIGDSGYPLEPWLLVPISTPSNAKENKYNRLHNTARNSIERAFGVLKGRFKCLSRTRVLYYTHEKAINIIYSCTILHNILIKNQIPVDMDESDYEYQEVNDNLNSQAETEFLRDGERVRARYVSSL